MNRVFYVILALLAVVSCSKHQTNPSSPDNSSNPADSNFTLAISVGDSAGSVTQHASSDTFLIRLVNPAIIKNVPLILNCAIGAVPSEGKHLTDTSWSDTVDLSQNQVHPITITAKDGKTAKYQVAFAYFITNYSFLGEQMVFAVAGHGDSVFAGDVQGLAISANLGVSFGNAITWPTGSTIYSIALQGNTIYAGLEQGGLMISPDGGQTIQVYQFNFPSSPTAPNATTSVYAQGDTVYAGTSLNGLYISHDRGNSFSNVVIAPGPYNAYVTGVYAQGSTIYVSTAGGIFISQDGGASFTGTNYTNIVPDARCNGIFVNNGVIYAADDHGLYESKDNGQSFSILTPALLTVNAVSVSGNMICAATGNGLMISTDGGASFATYTALSGVNGNSAQSVAIQGGIIYAGFVAYPGGLSVMTPR